MRIINITNTDKYVPGVNKTLKPGGATRELPLATLFDKGMLGPMLKGYPFRLKLNDDDRKLLGAVLAQDAMPLPEVKPMAFVSPADHRQEQEKAALKAKKVKLANRPVMAPTPKVLPACVNGQPPYATLGATLPDVKPGQAMSLEQLKQHNEAIAARKRTVLQDAASVLGSRI